MPQSRENVPPTLPAAAVSSRAPPAGPAARALARSLSASVANAAAPAAAASLASRAGHDTEVGQMLRALYKQPAYRAPPPTHFKPMAGPQPTLVGSGARSSSADPRAARLDRAAIAAVEASKPLPAGPEREAPPAPVDGLPSRRSLAAIAAARAAAAAGGDIEQAPVRPGRNTETEKRRLALTFQFKGGAALPAAALPDAVPGPLPLGLLAGAMALPSAAAARARAGDAAGGGGGAGAPSALYAELRRTYADLTAALDAARAFWDERRALAGGALKPADAREAAAEEARRVAELAALAGDMRRELERAAARA